MTTAKRLRRSLEEIALTDSDHGEADRSYKDGNTTDPEWLEQQDYGDEDECLLRCQNGGSCELGRAIHGFAAELLEDEDNVHFANRNTMMHCVCPPGWTGLECEIKLVECPEEEICFNGKKCLLSEDDFGMPFRHCECNATLTDFSLPYAAHFCGQTGTVSCAADRVTASHSFCKNGGKCLDVITSSNQVHKGCECTDGWEGPHCGHIAGTYPEAQPVEKKDKIAFSLFGFAVAFYILGTVWFYNRKRRRARASGGSSSSNSSPRNKKSSPRSFSLSPRGSKKNKKVDYDAFLDEYESSNDYRESGGEESFDLMSYKSKSYSDFEASEGEYESDEDGVQGYNDQVEDGESYDSSDEEENDTREDDIASPLYGEPKKELDVL